MDDDWAVRVECDATRLGEDTPKRFFLDDRAFDVVDVVDRWLGRDHAYYKVRDAGKVTYILRQDALGRWQLVMLDRRPERQKLMVPQQAEALAGRREA